jgi:hypothetical protein
MGIFAGLCSRAFRRCRVMRIYRSQPGIRGRPRAVGMTDWVEPNILENGMFGGQSYAGVAARVRDSRASVGSSSRAALQGCVCVLRGIPGAGDAC